ncbi:MAG: WD40 repeat domain-containing protein [Myxococcota bacterium]
MKTSRMTLMVAVTVTAIASSATVAAVGTKHFTLDSAESFFGGELEGTAIHSDGSVRVGASTQRTEIKDVPTAYSVVSRGDETYVGTGTSGVVYRYKKRKLTKKYATGELLVASLAFGRDGALYAGTLPNGHIFRIDPKTQKITRFSTPKDAKHVWALYYDPKRGRLIAGTGPEGTIFEIDSDGVARVLHKGDASHVMSLTGDQKGTIFAGTSDSALVLKISPSDEVKVVHDFPGNEITSIDYLDGQLAVAANEFKIKPGAQFKGGGAPARPSARPPGTRPRPGKGQLWRVGRDGRLEQLIDSKQSHFTVVEWAEDGRLYAGSGAEGHVLQVEPDATYAIWADVEERQVLGLSLRSDVPSFVTGDAAAVYWVNPGLPKKPVWTSPTLDSGFASTWGRISWRGSGKLVIQTRSGNTQEPDDTWSPWSKKLKAPAKVSSPPSRFIQVRAQLPANQTAELRTLDLYYLPQNQRPRVSAVKAGSKAPKPTKPGGGAQSPPPASTLVKLSWTVVNPDQDPVRFRLSYRREDGGPWRPMFLEDTVLNQPKYTWDTESIPDGYYLVKVDASDEEANPENFVMHSEVVSQAILVDNHPPRITKLAYRNGKVQGEATDAVGPIARLQASIDAGPWRDIFPKDLLLDSPKEAFEMKLTGLEGDTHIVAIRAYDAAGNRVTDEIIAKVR